MGISFFPLGIPFSSSRSNTATLAITTSLASFPTTAALAQFVSGSTGPVGPDYETVTVLRLI
jgi:hypothetical protein